MITQSPNHPISNLRCPVCGAPVPPSKGGRPRKFCSLKCACKAAQSAFRRRRNEYARENEPTKLAAKALAIQEKREAKRRALEKLRETAPITVEERDLRNSELGQIVRIETRGRVPCGSFSPRFVKHN